MRNLRLTLEYDGSDFCGWQYQPGQRSVQSEVESALGRLTQQKMAVIAAGRTDSGVHALGQVINFHTDSRLAAEVFVRGANALLPKDIRVLACAEVPESFNARYDARRRTYRYRICKRPVAIGRQYAWFLPLDLELTAMQEAASLVEGLHDFRSFCRDDQDLTNHHCQVYRSEWLATDSEYIFEISANRFLHNMVRILVGTCVEIGRGVLASGAITAILAARDRREAGRTAPAHGLFLLRVTY